MMKQFIFLISFAMSIHSWCQKKDIITSYKEKQKQLSAEIEFLNDEINKLSATQKNIEQKAVMLYKKISLYQELLNNANIEIQSLSSQIEENQKQVLQLQQNIELIKHRLIFLIRTLYMLRKPSASLSFILSANSYQQIRRRYLYLSQVKTVFKDYILQLKRSIEQLKHNMKLLEDLTNEKKLLISNFEQLVAKHQQTLKEQDIIRKESMRKEKELRQQVQLKKKQLENLNKQIAKAIKEAEKTKYVAKKPSPSLPSNANKESTTDPKVHSSSYNRNLPWPVQGSIVGYFGEHPHPLFNDITIKNNGIDIRCTSGSKVKAVANGIVSQIIQIEKNNYLIIIKHDGFLSVYSNISEPTVQKNQEVTAGSVIGIIQNSDNPLLHFEIWNEKTPENPLNWLSR